MSDSELSGAEAVDATIAIGVDLDGSPSPEKKAEFVFCITT